MSGEELAVAVRMSRPMDGETFAAGLTVLQPDGSCRVAFYRYRNRGGIVGRVSAREMATLAPGLVAALKADGAKLKEYLADEAGLPPGGVGSSQTSAREERTREGAGVRDCNGETRSRYARGRSMRAGFPSTCEAGRAGADGVLAGVGGGFARGSRLTARDGEGE